MPSKLRVAYFGSPECSARFLEKILHDPDIPIEVVLVITQPDKPVGRKQTLTPSPVKVVALEENIPVIHSATPEDLVKNRVDLGLVFAYGRIIKEEVLKATQHGFWNIHPSLLPAYRGASPTAYTLLMGDEFAGCTLMLMDSQMDHGPIIAQDSTQVNSNETQVSLLEKLTYVGYYLLKEALQKFLIDELEIANLPVQNDSLATFTRMLKRDDGFIEPQLIRKAMVGEKISSEELPLIIKNYLGQNSVSSFPILYAPFIVYNTYRGLHPWPGIWTYMQNGEKKTRLKITHLSLESDQLRIHTVQIEGKNEVSFEQFLEAYPHAEPFANTPPDVVLDQVPK